MIFRQPVSKKIANVFTTYRKSKFDFKLVLDRSRQRQFGSLYIQLFRERLSEKKHQSARDKTVRWYGYSLEFCMLA